MRVEKLPRAKGGWDGWRRGNAEWGDKRKEAAPCILLSVRRNLHNFRNLAGMSSSSGSLKKAKSKK